jgi:GWxTD domain-containing protein
LLLTGTNDNSQKIPGANALSSIDSDSKGMNLGVFLISIPQDRFIPGKYEIIIKNPELKDSMRKIFYVKWESMPISLREVDNALNSMKIIIDDDQYDKLDKGNKKDVFNHILNYWKKFDPTPKTQFNEAMDEFFSRVDYAGINYRSIRERDGYKTERGKVYILNGKPDSIETIPTGSGTKENWIYKKIKKIYYFETNSAGLYKIIKIEDIVN